MADLIFWGKTGGGIAVNIGRQRASERACGFLQRALRQSGFVTRFKNKDSLQE